MINLLLFVILILIGLFIISITIKKPILFWPLIIFISIVGSGLMINGYTFYDEYLIGCVVIGVFVLNVYTSFGRNRKVDNIHNLIFVLFLVYLFYQAIYGAIILYSPRKIRWVIFFILLLLINSLSKKEKYPKLCPRDLSYFITVCSLIYYGFYIIYGYSFELFGLDRHDIQYATTQKLTSIWATTAYTIFPMVISLPCAIILIQDKKPIYRRLGLMSIILVIINVVYYQSRVGVLVILIFSISSIPVLGVKKWLIFAVLSILSFSLIFILMSDKSIEFYINDVFGTWSRIISANETNTYSQDMDRYIWTIVAFESIRDNWWHFLFGHGFRSSGYVVAPLVYDLFRAYGHTTYQYSSNVGTEMFTNLLVETGMIGLSLYTLNYFFLVKNIFSNKSNPHRYMLISALIISYFWMFIINLIDVLLLYLLIMPNGLIAQLNQSTHWKTKTKTKIMKFNTY